MNQFAQILDAGKFLCNVAIANPICFREFITIKISAVNTGNAWLNVAMQTTGG